MTEELCQRFRNHLLDNFNGDTPMNYFSEFKRMIKAATKQGYFKCTFDFGYSRKYSIVAFIEVHWIIPSVLNCIRIALLTSSNKGRVPPGLVVLVLAEYIRVFVVRG